MSHKNGPLSKKICDSFNVEFFLIFSPSTVCSILTITCGDSNFNGFWAKIIIVKRSSKIVNRLNIPSTAAESLKVLEKRPETAVNFVFFVLFLAILAIFECVTDCVMCDASGHSLCSQGHTVKLKISIFRGGKRLKSSFRGGKTLKRAKSDQNMRYSGEAGGQGGGKLLRP